MPANRAVPQIVRREERRETFVTQGYRITPVARLTRVAWLGGSFAWERPAAVEVERDGYSRRVPIRDATTIAVAAIVAAGVAFRMLAARRGRAAVRKGSDRA